MPRRRFLSLCALIMAAGLGIYGALLIDQYGLAALISLVSVYGVTAIIFTESSLPIGFFLPGDSLIFTTGFLIHQGIISFDIHLMALTLFCAASIGNCVGYSFGRHIGSRLFKRKNSAVFHAQNLKRAKAFYRHHGGKTLIFARFIPVLRTFAPIIAGTSNMNYRRFLFFNIIGAFIWAVGYTYLGFFAGAWSQATGLNIQYGILAIIFLALLLPITQLLKSGRRRTAIRRSIRRHIRAFFSA